MKSVISLILFTIFISGCATWSGIKEDTSDAVDWSKRKVNNAAGYIKEKTE